MSVAELTRALWVGRSSPEGEGSPSFLLITSGQLPDQDPWPPVAQAGDEPGHQDPQWSNWPTPGREAAVRMMSQGANLVVHPYLDVGPARA